jgi:hypothetical protein
MDKVEVTKIVLKVGRKSVLLNLSEARELKALLDELLGDKKAPVYIPYPCPSPTWPIWPTFIPNPPHYWITSSDRTEEGGLVTLCASGTGAQRREEMSDDRQRS